jgi:hypothetical protein
VSDGICFQFNFTNPTTGCTRIRLLCSSFNMRDQISDPFRVTGEIVVSHILMFKFFDSDVNTKDSELHGSEHPQNLFCS